jgi:hypothetical protein
VNLDPQIRTRQKFIKTRNAYNSGFGGDLDLRSALKSNVDEYGFRFPSSDSRIFMRTPDSHGIRTIRYGSPPPDPVELQTIFMCEGYNLRHLLDSK